MKLAPHRPGLGGMRPACRAAMTWCGIVAMLSIALPAPLVVGQDRSSLPSPEELKQMSIEELMEVRITSVSRQPQRVFGAPSAIQLVTRERIARSGAIRLPQALRLVPSLQVAQVNAHDWAVTARGFNGAPLANNSLADKLLVMIDGRSVYTPLFGGVFWDVQNVLLEDVDRIEVVSGPGGTLWGANAVNGVINVVTRPTRDTQGLYASVSAGSFLQDHVAARYGGRLSDRAHYRVWVQRMDYRDSEMPDGGDRNDAWGLTQGGFRVDVTEIGQGALTLQGGLYGGAEGAPTEVKMNGQNLMLRWSQSFSSESELAAHVYADRTERVLPEPGFEDRVTTFDVDLQHGFRLGNRNHILWGAGYRFAENDVQNSQPLSFIPANRTLHLLSGFVQDEISLIPERVVAIVGTKVERNDFSGTEFQPGIRVAWTPPRPHTVWAAVSRAIRSPARLDLDVLTPTLTGYEDFKSEKVLAFEAGYRVQLLEDAVLSIATFYNRYDDLRSINVSDGTPALIFANDHRARSGGIEITGAVQVLSGWRLRGGYTFLEKKVTALGEDVVPGSEAFEGIDPHHQVLVQSMLDLPGNIQLDFVGRYVDVLPMTILTPRIPPYIDLDARLAWRIRAIDLSIVGGNLLSPRRQEFGPYAAIPRNVYGRIVWRL